MQLPDPGLVNFYRLAENRIVYLDAEIDESVLELQKMIFSWNLEDKDMGLPTENRQPIVLIIDSPGGMLDETMSICSTIKLSKTPIYTVNVAQAYSGAALIFMSGHRRFVFPYAKTMIHSGGTTGIGGTFEQTEAAQNCIENRLPKWEITFWRTRKSNRKYSNEIRQKTGISLLRKPWTMVWLTRSSLISTQFCKQEE